MTETNPDIVGAALTKLHKPRSKAQLLASSSNWQKGRFRRIEGAIKYELGELDKLGLSPNSIIPHQLRRALELVQTARSYYSTLVAEDLAKYRKEKEDAQKA